jgi:DNA-binding response OmpR family regulator
MDEKSHILVVDDDARLRSLLHRYLGEAGFQVGGVANAEEMDNYLGCHSVDLIILDLMLPGEDGLSIARRLSGPNNPLILMLTARGEEIDRIIGLEMGADDYLPKPFNPRELLARIKAILRRNNTPAREPDNDSVSYRFADYILDVNTQTLLHQNKGITLTPGDFNLLEAFVTHPNRVLSRDQLVDLLKGYERSPYDRSIDVGVTRLRRKIEIDPSHPVFIRTIWGKGYIFTPEGAAPKEA